MTEGVVTVRWATRSNCYHPPQPAPTTPVFGDAELQDILGLLDTEAERITDLASYDPPPLTTAAEAEALLATV